MSRTAALLVDHVIPHVPVRQQVLSLPSPLRVVQVTQPELATPVLQWVQCVVTRHLLDHAGLDPEQGQGGGVTLIQRLGSAANLNIQLPWLFISCSLGAQAPVRDHLTAITMFLVALSMLPLLVTRLRALRSNGAMVP